MAKKRETEEERLERLGFWRFPKTIERQRIDRDEELKGYPHRGSSGNPYVKKKKVTVFGIPYKL